jgi:methionyl-tRNA formyltransferase
MKIGLLTTTGLSEFRLDSLKPVLRDKSFSIALAIIDDSPKKSFVQKIKKNLKKGRGGYIVIMAFQKLFQKNKIAVGTEKFCDETGIAIYKTKDIYSSESISKISESKLDILLLIDAFGIIKEPLLSLTPFGILSYHHGNMRKYRGQPPAFWELYNNEKEMGITVQILSSGLDCGIAVEEKTITIRKTDTLKKLYDRAMSESVNMMYEALKKLNTPGFIPSEIDSYGKVYTIPNLRQWIWFNLKTFWRRIK